MLNSDSMQDCLLTAINSMFTKLLVRNSFKRNDICLDNSEKVGCSSSSYGKDLSFLKKGLRL